MDTNDLEMLAQSGALDPEQLREVQALLADIAAEDSELDGRYRLHESGIPTRGPVLEPRERNLTAGAALVAAGVPFRETETVQLTDLPVVEQLAALDTIGSQRAAAMSETSGIPFRGGHDFLGAEAELRAMFDRPEDMSADELLRNMGVPMAEARPAHEVVGELAKAVPSDHEDRSQVDSLVRKGAALSDDDRASVQDLSDRHLNAAPAADDDGDDVPATLTESASCAALRAGGIPLRHGVLA